MSVTSLSPKEHAQRVVNDLPDDATYEDVVERLILLRKVNVGLAQDGQGVPQSVAETEFRKQRQERSWNRG